MTFTASIRQHITNLAHDLNVEPAALLAVMQVESQGKTHGSDGLVPIRWEGHYFWRLLPENKRVAAQAKGLASPISQKVKNPRRMRDRYALLERAKAIDPEAALKSISMGVGQVMGAHAERLGFTDVFDMWEANQLAEGQYETVARFIRHFGLIDELQERNWAGFARAYNGPAYAKNQYDVKLARAYKANAGAEQPIQRDPGFLRLGDPRKARVKQLQERLNELGYRTGVDGDFGPETKRTVQEFQIDQGLSADGVVGPATQSALDVATFREVTPERANTTVKQLKKRSSIARNGGMVKNTGYTIGTAAVGVEVAEETGALEVISSATEKVNEVASAVGPLNLLMEFAQDNIWALFAIGGLILGVLGHKIVQARLRDHRTGNTS